jgi:hypothetical protein
VQPRWRGTNTEMLTLLMITDGMGMGMGKKGCMGREEIEMGMRESCAGREIQSNFLGFLFLFFSFPCSSTDLVHFRPEPRIPPLAFLCAVRLRLGLRIPLFTLGVGL